MAWTFSTSIYDRKLSFNKQMYTLLCKNAHVYLLYRSPALRFSLNIVNTVHILSEQVCIIIIHFYIIIIVIKVP